MEYPVKGDTSWTSGGCGNGPAEKSVGIQITTHVHTDTETYAPTLKCVYVYV